MNTLTPYHPRKFQVEIELDQRTNRKRYPRNFQFLSSSVFSLLKLVLRRALTTHRLGAIPTTSFQTAMQLQDTKKLSIASLCYLLLLGISSESVSAFVPSKTTSPVTTNHEKHSTELNAFVPTTAEAIQEMANARFAFGMCFYGALGIGSIGRELIPIVFGRYQTTSSLESDGSIALGSNAPTLDDEDLGIWGYPEKIYRKDVESILNNPMKPLAIAKKYPIAQDADADKRYTYTHMAESVPFLGYEGFVKANPNANPVALRAVFDSFSNSIGGSNAVSPITAENNMDLYLDNNKSVTGALAKKLNGGKSLGIAAFVFLLVLLGVGDALAIFHLWKGWFPEWQGFSDMPASLFDQNIGILVLPNFFVGDVPPLP